MTIRELGDPALDALLAYWERVRGTRPMPARRDIDPLGLGPKALPHIALIDLVDGNRFRFRLCGSAIIAAAGGNLVGRFVDELSPDGAYSRYIVGLYALTRERARPVFSETLYRPGPNAPARQARRLLCPLSEDGIAITGLIGAQTFQLLPGSLPTKPDYTGDFLPVRCEVL